MSERRRHDAIALSILTSVVALLFIDVLLGINDLYYSDLAFYSYPAKHVLREIVLGGDFPSWNPWISAGQPMAANPAHEVFYPLTWLILLPSYDFGFRLLVVAHVCIAGWTMYALLRSMAIARLASLLGALSFALGGIVLSTIVVLPFLFSIAWLPATCLYTRRFLLHRRRRDFALAALFLGVQFVIGEPTTALQSGILLGLFAVWTGVRRRSARRVAAAVLMVGAISIGALLVSAAQILPAVDHTRDSVRARGFDFAVVTDWSMPLVRVAEWVYPNLLGHQRIDGRWLYWGEGLYPHRDVPYIRSLYPGLLLAALALAGIAARKRGSGLVLTTLVVSVILAAGENTPLWRILYDLGIGGSIRYPEKFILFGTFVVTVFGAMMLHRLLRGEPRVRAAALVIAGIVTAIAAVAAAIGFTPAYPALFERLWSPGPARLPGMIAASRSAWLLAALRGIVLFILLRSLPRLGARAGAAALAAFVALDLAMLFPELTPRVAPEFLRDTPAAAQQLPPQRDTYRLLTKAGWGANPPEYALAFPDPRDRMWILRNALYPMRPALHGVRTVFEIDYDLTSLQRTADFAEAMFELGKHRSDWAVVAASMSNAWYGTDWAPPAEALRRANGDPRVLQPIRIVRLPRFPRYYFADRVETIRDRRDFVAKLARERFPPRTAFVYERALAPRPGVVQSVEETANTARIEVETAGPAFLVMSVTPHKYWTVTVDGVEAPALVTNVGYQGVVVPAAGRHVVEMRYRNPLVAAGGAISFCALLWIAYAAARRRGSAS